MTTATLGSPALEFDFDTLGLDLLALDAPDNQPGDSNIDQGNEPPAPFHPSSHPNPEVLFTDNQMFTLEDDEAPASLEAEPLSPLQLPASIPAAMEAALESPALEVPAPAPACAPGLEPSTPATSAPAPCGFLTRRQELTKEINALESQVVEYSETDYELAEKVSQVRKWRKEALEQLRGLKWQLNAMSDEDAEKPVIKPAASKPVPTQVEGNFTSGGTYGVAFTVPDSESNPFFNTLRAPTNPTIDHGGAQRLTALGVTPKQLEKFEIEGILTVSQFERALADRSIESVRGIQERTLDKLREALWEFRKQHPIPDPDDRPVLTASEWEDGFGLARGELHGKPEATEITPELCEKAKGAGRSAGISGVNATENPHEEGSVLGDHWDSGWDEGCAERLDFMQLASANQEPTPAPKPTPVDTTNRPKPSAFIGSINLATDPLTSTLANIIIQEGRNARAAGFERIDNPLRTGASVHREDLWNDGWDEVDQEQQEASKMIKAAGAKGLTGAKPEKPARKPRAKKAKSEAKAEAGIEAKAGATDGTEATKPE